MYNLVIAIPARRRYLYFARPLRLFAYMFSSRSSKTYFGQHARGHTRKGPITIPPNITLHNNRLVKREAVPNLAKQLEKANLGSLKSRRRRQCEELKSIAALSRILGDGYLMHLSL